MEYNSFVMLLLLLHENENSRIDRAAIPPSAAEAIAELYFSFFRKRNQQRRAMDAILHELQSKRNYLIYHHQPLSSSERIVQ